MTHSFLRRFTTLFLFREQQESLPHSLGFLNPIPVSELLHKKKIYEGDSEKLFTHVQGPIKHLEMHRFDGFPAVVHQICVNPEVEAVPVFLPVHAKVLMGFIPSEQMFSCVLPSVRAALSGSRPSIDTRLISYRIMMSFAGTLDCFILFFLSYFNLQ